MTRTRAVHLSVHSLSPVAPSAILSHLTLPYLTLGTHHVSHPLHTRQRRDVAWLLFHCVVYYCQSVVSDIDTNRFRFGARALPNHIHAASETARYSCPNFALLVLAHHIFISDRIPLSSLPPNETAPLLLPQSESGVGGSTCEDIACGSPARARGSLAEKRCADTHCEARPPCAPPRLPMPCP